ncbi:MAG: DUF2892 domain-containing protein [Methanosarcinaceae archaeon]|nr:DUF2892 domain-containing protein [Methanosarcinaceae archaeon]
MNIKQLFLEKNIGGLDLLLRAFLGSFAITVLAMDFVENKPLWNWLLGLVAFTGLFTSITRHCSPYVLLGINTAEQKTSTKIATLAKGSDKERDKEKNRDN